MAKTLSIEQKAELYDKILATIKTYYSKLDEELEKKKKPKKTKEQINNGTISFHLFSSKYPRPEGMPGAGKIRWTLNDDERQKAIDYIPIYYKEKFSIKDGVNFIAGPIKYLSEKYWENKVSIDYTDLKIFDEMKRLGKDETLKNSLGDKYLEVFRRRKDSEYYVK